MPTRKKRSTHRSRRRRRNYFEEHCDKLDLKHELRECQRGAYWATLAHFTTSDYPALVVMPTGAGKTAVMMMIAFGLRASRVLVITPATVLRDQTAEKFTSLDDLIRAKAIPRNIKKPKVHVQEHRVTSAKIWNALRKYDVVVATPHTISREQEPDIVQPPEDLFDVVFMDEAHHAPARTWNRLLRDFVKSKRILLTATPFREDKRRLPADIVYDYPIGKAIDAGIYSTIEYHPAMAISRREKDSVLCQEAKALLTKEKEQSRRTKILIRINRVNKAKKLVKLYKSRGILVDVVNYEKTLQENHQTLDMIRSDKLDGVICIGMLGEGLDIPELKIAVFHDPPKSFPFTLQYIGRISRSAEGQIGNARVIADPTDVRGRMGKLYREDIRWRELIPKLVDEEIEDLRDEETFYRRGVIKTDIYVDPKGLNPFFSVRLYKINPNELKLGRSLDLGEKLQLKYTELLDNDRLLVLVTQMEKRPPWTRYSALDSTHYDLHLYYYHQRSRTLFESTTSDYVARRVRPKILKGTPRRLGGQQLVRVMQDGSSMEYRVVGLANVIGPNPSVPAYKTVMGSEVQWAVRPTEGSLFVPGHVVAKLPSDETRGIGNLQSRVWAIKRGSLKEFRDWCNIIGNQLVKVKSIVYPNMEFFRQVEEVNTIQDRPIAVVFNWAALRFPLRIGIFDSEMRAAYFEVTSPEFEIKKLERGGKILRVSLFFNPQAESVPLQYNVAKNEWILEERRGVEVIEDTPVGFDRSPLEEFLIEHPPVIHLGKDGAIINGQLYRHQTTLAKMPDECFAEGIEWDTCDTTVEFVDEGRGRYPMNGKKVIHDWLEDMLIKETSADAIILKDHARGEIADFVVLEPIEKMAKFYHCKASTDSRPGARIDDLKVLEQAYRSSLWIRNADLISEIAERSTGRGRPSSKLVKGTTKVAKDLSSDFRPNEWRYQVVIVQPGLDCKKVVKKENTNSLLIACYEYLSFGVVASLAIMGS